MDYNEENKMIKLNAWDRFNQELQRQEDELTKGNRGNNNNFPQELSISPDTLVLTRLLFGKFEK